MKLDTTSQLVTVPGALRWDELETKLQKRGWTSGYRPMPATRVSLAVCLQEKRPNVLGRRYGEWEDMCVGLKASARRRRYQLKNVPRAATGPDFKRLFLGGEGQWGKIEEVTLRIHHKPQKKIWGLIYTAQDSLEGMTRKMIGLKGSLAFMAEAPVPTLPSPLRRPGMKLMMGLYFEGVKDLVEAHYHYVRKTSQELRLKFVPEVELTSLASVLVLWMEKSGGKILSYE